MITEEQYNYYNSFRQVLELFNNTGQYVGGCDALFDYMNIADKGCDTCKAEALLEAHTQIKLYESSL